MWLIQLVLPFLALANLSAAPSQDEIQQKERELTDVRERLEACRKEKILLEGKEASLLEKLESIDKELNLTHRLLSKLNKKEKRVKEDIQATEKRIGNLEGKLEDKKEILRGRLVAIYKKGKLHPFEILLSSHTFTDGFRRMKYLALIARQDRRVCDDIARLKGRLDDEKEGFTTKLGELKKVVKETKSEEENIEKEKGTKKGVLTEVRNKKEQQEKIAEALREAEEKLQKLIEDLERRRREELAGAPIREGDHYFETHKGGIRWPVDGSVISKFGKQLHPRYGTATRNNGIDIRAGADSRVVAVGDGVVAYADRFLGYGEIVLLDHKGGFYTLYAHLSESRVMVGDEVKAGQLIATVGGVGSPEETVVHFELRVDGKPVDPLPWLAGR